MSDKKQIFEATKATDKRHFRKPKKVRPNSGQGSSTTHKGKSLMEHFKKQTNE